MMQNNKFFISFHSNKPYINEYTTDEKSFYEAVVEHDKLIEKEYKKSIRSYNRFVNVSGIILILLSILWIMSFTYEIVRWCI